MAQPQALHVIDRPEEAAGLLKPVRLRILRALGPGASAAGVARQLGLARQRVNYHLRELERAGLAELVEERRKGNCTERVLRARAVSWVVDPAVFGDAGPEPAEFADRFSAAQLTALASQTIRELSALRRIADAQGKRVATLSLQSEVRFASAEVRHAFTEELTRTVARLVAKYYDAHAPRGRSFRVLVGAYPRPARPVEPAAGRREQR